ncbi:MAG: hypothetical protein WCK29_03355 [archaeon]
MSTNFLVTKIKVNNQPWEKISKLIKHTLRTINTAKLEDQGLYFGSGDLDFSPGMERILLGMEEFKDFKSYRAEVKKLAPILSYDWFFGGFANEVHHTPINVTQPGKGIIRVNTFVKPHSYLAVLETAGNYFKTGDLINSDIIEYLNQRYIPFTQEVDRAKTP